MKTTLTKKRYDILDLLRGIALISMILYHLCFDLMFLFSVDMPWFVSKPAMFWQSSIGITFILLAGISSRFSHSNVRRGIAIFLLAMLLSLGTYLIFPDEIIVFGVLHFIGAACLLTGLLQKPLKRVPPLAGAIVCAALFLLTYELPYGALGIGGIDLIRLPEAMYQTPGLFLLGFPAEDFFSSDYFPLMPWIFWFWTGFYLWELIKNWLPQQEFCSWKLPVFNLVGRHTLVIYMLHQPIIFGLLYLCHQCGLF